MRRILSQTNFFDRSLNEKKIEKEGRKKWNKLEKECDRVAPVLTYLYDGPL